MFHSSFYKANTDYGKFKDMFGFYSSSDDPNYSAYRTDKGLSIVVPLVGCGKDDISIKYKEDAISITYDRSKCKLNGSKREDVTLDIFLNGNPDLSLAKAKIENGLLQIDVPTETKNTYGVIQLK